MIIVNSRFLTQSLTGVQRFAIEISLRLKAALGEEIKFLAPKGIIDFETSEKLDVTIIGRNRGHLWEQIDLPFYMRRHKGDILVNLANTAPIMVGNKISCLHDCAFYRHPRTFSKKFVAVYKILIPLVIKSSKHLLTVSEFSKNEIEEIYPNAKEIKVVYNAVSDIFKPSPVEVGCKQKYMLAVSSINERKNFRRVVTAFKKANVKDLHLKIIGDNPSGNFKTDVDSIVESENVEFLGRVSDRELVSYYNNALAFIYPSIYEGFGIPPLEAQACDCPVLISSIPALQEVFQESALYCDPESIDDIANKITSLMDNDLRADLRGRGRINLERFSWERSTDVVLKLIKKMQLNS